MSLLENIHSPQDLKKIPVGQLHVLAQELRDFLIDSVQESGGHLSSNLGVVELTLALHYVFSSPEDVFVWDVGHQTYVHKILTGRKKDMKKIRSLGGISGFPKFQESPHDSYNTGHAGTSISQALGEAAARDLKKEKKQVVAVIGDASIASGMAFEALNHAGHIRHPFLVILNDNEMSISANVGALSFSLNRLITTRFYKKWSRFFFRSIEWLPFIGPITKRVLLRFGSNMKSAITELQFFEELGFRYLGPLDGHDIPRLINMLDRLKRVEVPTILHVVTKKGKGYTPAEQDPTRFHGVSASKSANNKEKVDAEKLQTAQTSETKTTPIKEGKSPAWGLSEFAGRALTFLAGEDENICVITPAMTEGSGLTSFAKTYPQRFFDTGITEQHATAFSGALAKGGMSPFLAIYSTFLQRGYDQLIHDILLMQLPVKLIIDRAGAVGNDGETHQGLYDFAFMNALPNIEIFSPADAQDFLRLLSFMAKDKTKTMAVRFAKRSFPSPVFEQWEKEITENKTAKNFSPYEPQQLREGSDIVFFCEGAMTANGLQAAEILQQQGINAQVLSVRCLKPLPAQALRLAAKNKFAVFTIENHVQSGGVGWAIEHALADVWQQHIHFKAFAFPDKPIQHGSIEEVEKFYGLDAANIATSVLQILRDNNFFKAKNRLKYV